MPLKVIPIGKGEGPIIGCDQCNKRIISAKEGNYIWDPEGVIFYTHKWCHETFERKHPGSYDWGTMELNCLPVYLASNLKIDLQDAIKQAEMLSRIGR